MVKYYIKIGISSKKVERSLSEEDMLIHGE